jgi:hypothetical protein
VFFVPFLNFRVRIFVAYFMSRVKHRCGLGFVAAVATDVKEGRAEISTTVPE